MSRVESYESREEWVDRRAAISAIIGVGTPDFGINQLDYLAHQLSDITPASREIIDEVMAGVDNGEIDVAEAGYMLRSIEAVD